MQIPFSEIWRIDSLDIRKGGLGVKGLTTMSLLCKFYWCFSKIDGW